MNDTLVIVLTGVSALATAVYAFYSVQLYRASQATKEIARQAALMQLWSQLLDYERLHEDAPTAESRFYGEFADSLIKYIVTELMVEVRSSRTQGAVTFRREARSMLERHEIGENDLAWLRPIADA